MKPIWFDNTETGAPVVNSTAGAVVAMLKAVLVTGFNIKSVSSIVVAAGVATTTCASHGYSAAYGKLVKISGAPEAALNGNHQIGGLTTNTFTFPAVGVADGTYTGMIDARRAPLGWTEEFNDGAGTKSIFKRSAPSASASMLRVVDTLVAPATTIYATTSMVETATGIDTFTGEAPTAVASQVWMRGAANATPKKWVVVGSESRVWVLLQGSASQAFPYPYFFGDPKPLHPGDVNLCFHVGNGSTSATSSGSFALSIPVNFSPSAGASHLTFQRTLNGLTLDDKGSLSGSGAWGNGLYAAGISTPVPIVGDYYLKTATEVRARLPELFLPQANNPFSDLTGYSLGGRELLSLTVNIGNTTQGQMMLDLSSDWD